MGFCQGQGTAAGSDYKHQGARYSVHYSGVPKNGCSGPSGWVSPCLSVRAVGCRKLLSECQPRMSAARGELRAFPLLCTYPHKRTCHSNLKPMRANKPELRREGMFRVMRVQQDRLRHGHEGGAALYIMRSHKSPGAWAGGNQPGSNGYAVVATPSHQGLHRAKMYRCFCFTLYTFFVRI